MILHIEEGSQRKSGSQVDHGGVKVTGRTRMDLQSTPEKFEGTSSAEPQIRDAGDKSGGSEELSAASNEGLKCPNRIRRLCC